MSQDARLLVTQNGEPGLGTWPSCSRRVGLGAIITLLSSPWWQYRPALASTSEEEVVDVQGTPVDDVKAIASLMDGRDALIDIESFPGSQGGRRARVMRQLPKLGAKIELMTALLPAAVLSTQQPPTDDAITTNNADDLPVALVDAVDLILIGAKNALTLVSFVKDERPFEDSDIPIATVSSARESVQLILSQVPKETLISAQNSRCFDLINQAGDYQDMKDIANTNPACQPLNFS